MKKLFLTKTRWLVTIMMLTILSVGNVWADHTKVKAGDLVSGNKYIITATYNNNTYYLVPGDITTSTNRGSYSSSLTDAAAWTFTAVSGGWTITTMVGDDLYYLYNGSSANSVASYSNDDDPLVYTITETSSGANTVYINGNSRYLALYTSGSNWRAYSSTSQANSQSTIQLYSVGPSGYTISYTCNGGTPCPSQATEQTVLPNPLPTVTQSGYTFAGWYTDSNFGTAATPGASLSGNVTLYAKWTCTVTWIADGVTKRTDSNQVKGANMTPPSVSPLPCGDKLAGWTDETGTYVHGTSTLYTGATIPVSGNKTYYAVFADKVTPAP